MSAAHCFKKVVAAPAEPAPTVRELVAKYGDSWALMAGTDRAGWAVRRSGMADLPFDRREAATMRAMERGELCRCGE